MKYVIWTNDSNDIAFDVITADTPEKPLNICDRLVKFKTNNKHSLMEDLNEMQLQHYQVMPDDDTTVFASKYSIPMYWVNLILFKYGIKIEETK